MPGVGVAPIGRIAATTLGTPLDGITVTRRFQALLARVGLPRQRFHDLGYECASLLLAQGVAPRVVMETLGHSQISLTLDTYSHLIPELGRQAARRMDELLAIEPAAPSVAEGSGQGSGRSGQAPKAPFHA